MRGNASQCFHGVDGCAVVRDDRPGVRPAAGVRELDADDEAGVRAEPRTAGGARLVEQALQLRRGFALRSATGAGWRALRGRRPSPRPRAAPRRPRRSGANAETSARRACHRGCHRSPPSGARPAGSTPRAARYAAAPRARLSRRRFAYPWSALRCRRADRRACGTRSRARAQPTTGAARTPSIRAAGGR